LKTDLVGDTQPLGTLAIMYQVNILSRCYQTDPAAAIKVRFYDLVFYCPVASLRKRFARSYEHISALTD